MIFSLSGLLVKFLKSKLDAELAKKTPIGGTVQVKSLARGVKIEGITFEVDAILRRTE